MGILPAAHIIWMIYAFLRKLRFVFELEENVKRNIYISIIRDLGFYYMITKC